MITGEDLKSITENTLSNTATLILTMIELRSSCNFPNSEVDQASEISSVSTPNPSQPACRDDDITEKRAKARRESSLDWLAHLDAEPSHQTSYTHPIKHASPLDIFECGIIAHNRVPEKIFLSRYSHIIIAIFGHDRFYARSTGKIPLFIDEKLDDNTIRLEGSAFRRIEDQPTQETPALRVEEPPQKEELRSAA